MTVKKWPDYIFVLIPAYQCAKELNNFLPKLLRFVPSEFVLILDDASNDDTRNICKMNNVDYSCHLYNKGKGAALRSGFKKLIPKGARWILTMDADGQHAPEDIHHFIEMGNKHPAAGIIIGARKMKIGAMPLIRIFSNKTTSLFLSWLSGRRIKDSQCGYRLYSSELIRKTETRYNRFQMESEIILKSLFNGFPVFFVDIQTLYCSTVSHISHLKDTLRWLIAVFSVRFELTFKK